MKSRLGRKEARRKKAENRFKRFRQNGGWYYEYEPYNKPKKVISTWGLLTRTDKRFVIAATVDGAVGDLLYKTTAKAAKWYRIE